jgi:hypothetical protein
MKCLFCGGSTDFMTHLENVCLSCGDKLQTQGVIVLSIERYQGLKNVYDIWTEKLKESILSNPPPGEEKK